MGSLPWNGAILVLPQQGEIALSLTAGQALLVEATFLIVAAMSVGALLGQLRSLARMGRPHAGRRIVRRALRVRRSTLEPMCEALASR